MDTRTMTSLAIGNKFLLSLIASCYIFGAHWLLRQIFKTSPKPVEAFGLTFPNLVGLAAGYDKDATVVRGQNRKGKKVKYKLEGWLARIFQHEIDHLAGIIFTDRAEKIWKPEPEDYEDNV